MPTVIPGAIKRNVYLYSDDHTEKRDSHLSDVGWVNDEIAAEAAARIAADQQLQANIDAEETRAKAAETTLQANIDAEETRAKAAEALKENLSNKIASTSTYVSDDTHYATTKAVDARIAEISPKEVFVCIYGETTATEIQAAIDAGKAILLKFDAGISVYWGIYSNTTSTEHQFTCVEAPGSYIDVFSCKKATSVWSFQTAQLEMKTNKLSSTDTWVSDNTMYPSSAAVDARIAEISPKEIEWATYGTTTSAQLETWLTANKIVLLKYNNNSQIMRLDYRNSATSHTFHSIYSSGAANLPKVYEIQCNNNVWTNTTVNLQTTTNMRKSTDTWSSVDTQYPSCKAVASYVTEHAPSGVEWATYGTTTYSQIKSWNDAGKAVFLKYTTSGPVDYIMKLTICTPGGAFFCGVQGVSEYTAEVNPANQWSYNTNSLQASALVHEYQTWDEDDDTGYPTVASVSNYVASHSGGGLHVFTRGGTEALAEIQAAYDAGEVCVCYDEDQDVYMQLVSLSEWQASFIAVDGNRWLYNTNAWEGEWDDCWTNNLLIDAYVNKSTDTWSSSDSYIPSNKAVENYVAAHGGPIKIASTSNSASEIYAWQQAGNAVVLRNNGDLFALQYCNATNAYFTQVYAPGSSSDPQLYWYMVSGSTWSNGNYYLQKKDSTLETTGNKLASVSTWVSNDTKYPTTQAVANYVAAHSGGDTYEIAGDNTIFFPVAAMDWDDNNMRWKLTYYPSTGTSAVYSPRTNFRLLKNGETFTFDSNYWLNIKPYTTSGTRTYAAGSNVVAPTTTWGTTSASASPDGSKIGACFYMSSGSATEHNSNIGIYGKISPNTVVSSWDALSNFFWFELYNKNVSQSVPVCRKLMRFAPALVGNWDMTGATFAWITACKNINPEKVYMTAFYGPDTWYNGTVLRYTNTNAAGNCHYFVGLAYNSSDGGTYQVRFSRQEYSSSYDVKKITLT